MDKKEHKNSDKLTNLIQLISEKVVYKVLRNEQIATILPCVVATYDSVNNTATLYIPPDVTNASVLNYKNRTGGSLTPGDKVYLIYRFGEADQGWIAFR